MSKEQSEPADQGSGSRRHRSPSYPSIDLKTALQRVQLFYSHERRSAANIAVAARHWKVKTTSSSGLLTFAAVSSFGLMESKGLGENRTLRVSDLGLRILLDERPNSEERQAALKKAALQPKMHRNLWEKWGVDLPSDENIRHALIFEYKFNENSVSDFIAEYKATIAFAGLNSSDVLSEAGGDSEMSQEPESHMAAQKQPTPPPRQAPPAAPIPPKAAGQQDYPVPLGLDENGNLIFAYVRFAGGITKDAIVAIREALDRLEKKLPK